jgi:lipopolysaccharide export system protein LptA
MIKYRFLLSATIVALAGAAAAAVTTNTPPGEQEVGVSAIHFFYDGNKQQVIYCDDVVATNAQGTLSCDRLTINLPPEGSLDRQPTNAVAETNVVIDFVKQGDTNHITCERAIYTYLIIHGSTNDTITFVGSPTAPAKVENSKGWMTGEPLIWDNLSGNFSGLNTETHFKVPAQPASGTNPPAVTGPLNFLK